MPKFVQLIDYTREGVERFEEIPERLEAAEELAESMGGEVEAFYLTLGQYDAVAIVDVPDAKTVTAGSVATAQEGTIRTETLRAFEEDEIEEIIGMLPE